MKISVCNIICVILLCLGMGGCSKAPIDNDVEGFWQLESFTTHADNQTHPCTRMYFGITRQVAEISTRPYIGMSVKREDFVCRFSYSEEYSKVIMKDFKWRRTTGDNGVDVNMKTLNRYGINANPTTFSVQTADGKNLVLVSDYATLVLKRF